jgi:hypothetical protein
MTDNQTTYVGYYAMRGTTDLPVHVSAGSYGEAEQRLAVWRTQRNSVADDMLSARPIRIESDEYALAELEAALDRAQFADEDIRIGSAGRIMCENTLHVQPPF